MNIISYCELLQLLIIAIINCVAATVHASLYGSTVRKMLFRKAGIPWDRHGHRHRHGHARRLPREDRREDVGVSGDFPIQLATSWTRTTILADLSADFSDTRAFPREDPRGDVRWGCARVHV